MDYLFLKALHLIGVTLFLGNVTVTAWWKLTADRTRSSRVLAFAQRQVTLTDYVFTFAGATMIGVTGVLLAQSGGLWRVPWLHWSIGLFVLSAIVWIAALIPLQIKLGRMAAAFKNSGAIPERYWKLERAWAVLGIIATVLPYLNFYFMVYKP
jgi:uncharacterized membrane protein